MIQSWLHSRSSNLSNSISETSASLKIYLTLSCSARIPLPYFGSYLLCDHLTSCCHEPAQPTPVPSQQGQDLLRQRGVSGSRRAHVAPLEQASLPAWPMPALRAGSKAQGGHWLPRPQRDAASNSGPHKQNLVTSLTVLPLTMHPKTRGTKRGRTLFLAIPSF